MFFPLENNPVYAPTDPKDQSALLAALEKAVDMVPSGASKLVTCRYLVRLAYVAAMSGLAETVENAAKFLSRNDLKGLRKHLEEADVVHRGGQCPGIIVREQIAVMLPRYMKVVGNKIATLLSDCTSCFADLKRRQALCKAMSRIFNLYSDECFAIEGCGPYKNKRLAEVIILACLSPKIAVPHMTQDDLHALGGVWPLPDGSRRGLRKIFPGLRNKMRQQQGVKALSIVMGSGGNCKSVPASTISAMLCFWNEHKNGVLSWVPEWKPK